MGLMDYHARFYSLSLGKFIQPDIYIPNPGNSQSWNRYSYSGNNPIVFSDPSGHFRICNTEGSICSDDDHEPGVIFHVAPVEVEQGVEWTDEEIETITKASQMVGRKLADEFAKYGINVNWSDAIFLALGKNLKFWRQLETCASQNNNPSLSCYGQFVGGGTIYVYSNAPSHEVAGDMRFSIHEIGHAFDGATDRDGRNSVSKVWALILIFQEGVAAVMLRHTGTMALVTIGNRVLKEQMEKNLQTCSLVGYLNVGRLIHKVS